MNLQPQPNPAQPSALPEFAEPPVRRELQLAPTPPVEPTSEATALPAKPLDLQDASTLSSDRASDRRSEFNPTPMGSTPIRDAALSVPRIQMGSLFVGSSALGLVGLLLWMSAFHPEFDWQVGVSEYWYPYVGFVCLGVSGLIVLARESLRR
jgi:hypothetical protein